MKKYQWNIKSFAKNIDPAVAVEELNRIELQYGALTAETILDASKKRGTIFHSLFNWNDGEAANLYRLQQARTIINNVQIITISNGEERYIPVYEIITVEDGRIYRSIDSMNQNDIEQVKVATVRQLNALRMKLETYKQFQVASSKIDEAVKIVKKVKG